MLRVWSMALATLLCLASTTQYVEASTIENTAIKATSLKLRANPWADLKVTKRDFLTSSFRPDNGTVLGFFVDVVVGTPPQFFSLAFSSSSTTWLPTSNLTADEFCEEVASGNPIWSCYYDHFFEPSESSTFRSQRGKLDNFYGDGLFARGTWGMDTLRINQLAISNVSLGLASNWTNGAELGLGVDRERKVSPYPSLPEVMADQGYINSILYSIYINDIKNDGGELYFGAVDDAKYTGQLRTYESERVGRLPVTGVYWIDPDGTNSSLVAPEVENASEIGELQLGTPALWVPNEVYRALVNSMPGLTYATAYDAYTIECSVPDSQLGTLQFDLDGTLVSIHGRQMLVEYPIGENNCVFTVYQRTPPSTPGAPQYLLGSPFLRSAYSVWDYTNNQTSIAQSVPNAVRSVVREVPRGGIADLQPPDPDRADTAIPTASTAIPTGAIPTGPVSEPMRSSTNVGAIAGGTVGAVVAVGAAGFLAWFFMVKRRRRAPELPPAQILPGSASDGLQPDIQHNQFASPPFKPQMSQHTYGVQANGSGTHGQVNENWGTVNSNNSGGPESVTSGGTWPGNQEGYTITGETIYHYPSEMPTSHYSR